MWVVGKPISSLFLCAKIHNAIFLPTIPLKLNSFESFDLCTGVALMVELPGFDLQIKTGYGSESGSGLQGKPRTESGYQPRKNKKKPEPTYLRPLTLNLFNSIEKWWILLQVVENPDPDPTRIRPSRNTQILIRNPTL